MTGPVLRADGVTMRFGDVVALEQLDLQVAPGEFLVVVGASGCGKSTLLNLFAGFEQPTEGTVELLGERIAGVEPRCGMVFQSYALFPWLTVTDNIGFGPSARGTRDDKAIADLIRLVGIEGFEDHYPAQLSGGMRQRVALARTLANDPDVLLCDEPFAALDAMTRQVLQEELNRLVETTKKTVVFITHSIDEALLLADRIVVLTARPGRVKTEVANPLPRPRTAKVQLSADYLRLKEQIWESVQEEVLAHMRATR
ncbi:MAG: ABC transporter ATP-binding protein [Planctomycetota bacterium]|nr:ABC transporter ATP-binding protein [Planctomycetota bacterium]